jgi:hypothetical protein
MKNIIDYKNTKTAVLCTTEGESKKINDLIVSAGGRNLHPEWKQRETYGGKYMEGLEYDLSNFPNNCYCHKDYYATRGYTIILAKDFIKIKSKTISKPKKEIKEGDIVVCVIGGTKSGSWKEGNIYEAASNPNKFSGDLYYINTKPSSSGIYTNSLRHAKPNEIKAFKQGIYNINNISDKDEKPKTKVTKEVKDVKFKVGDIVVAKPGYRPSDVDSGGLLKGGSGYIEGKIYKIQRFSNGDDIFWGCEGGGLWCHSSRKATKEEIDAYNNGIRDISEILKKKPASKKESMKNEFQSGKWYTHPNYPLGHVISKYVKIEEVRKNTGYHSFIFSDIIDENGKHSSGRNSQANSSWEDEMVEVPVSEIQKYLPEGHPDKMLDKKTVELTSLPTKWKINPKNEDEDFVLVKWRDGGHGSHYSECWLLSERYWVGSGEQSGYTEITFDQFKKWVLKETESKESLLDEAKRRYPIGTKYKNIIGGGKCEVTDHAPHGEGITNGNNGWILYNGKWAEIIEESYPEYVKCMDNGYSSLDSSTLNTLGISNYGRSITIGSVYKTIKQVKFQGYNCYILEKDGKQYIIGEKGVEVSSRSAYEDQNKYKDYPNFKEGRWYLAGIDGGSKNNYFLFNGWKDENKRLITAQLIIGGRYDTNREISNTGWFEGAEEVSISEVEKYLPDYKKSDTMDYKDLEKNEIYYAEYSSDKYIVEARGDDKGGITSYLRINGSISFVGDYSYSGVQWTYCRIATYDEKEWFLACKKARKVINKEDIKKETSDSWCVKITKENQEQVKKWFDSSGNSWVMASIDAHYGITREGKKYDLSPGYNWKDYFNIIISTEEFYKKIGYTAKVEVPKVDSWCVQLTNENIDAIKKWGGLTGDYTKGNYYGIDRYGKISGYMHYANWNSYFDKLISTDDFYKKIGHVESKKVDVSFTNEITWEKILASNGQNAVCKISGNVINGIIHVESGHVYVLSNEGEFHGNCPRDTKGYKNYYEVYSHKDGSDSFNRVFQSIGSSLLREIKSPASRNELSFKKNVEEPKKVITFSEDKYKNKSFNQKLELKSK